MISSYKTRQLTPYGESFLDKRLCLDMGNTRIKAAIFEDNQLIYNEILTDFPPKHLQSLLQKHNIQYSIISSVRNHPPYFNEILQQYCNTFIELSHETAIPIQNNYATPETLGKDRLAAAIGASSLYPHSNCLIIDAGTCITFDFIDAQHTYHGGSISMGIDMRFKALHVFTDKLPLIERATLGNLIGNNTRQSILSGVIGGVVAELDGFIEYYQNQYAPLTVLITGGDTHFFESKLKSEIFACPNLVLIGLNKILDYNVAKDLE